MRPHLLPRLVAALPLLILLSGLMCTAGSWYISEERGYNTARANFEDELEHVVATLDKRIAAHEQTLRGAASLIQRGQEAGADSWRIFVRQLVNSESLDGAIAVGHVAFEADGPVLKNLVVLMASDQNTYDRMERAARRDLHNLWPDRASPRSRLLMLDEHGAVIGEDAMRPAESAMMLVPVLADGQRPGAEAVRGFVFSYFSPSLMIDAGLRNVARRARYSIAPQTGDAVAGVPLYEDKGNAEPAHSRILEATRTVQVGDAVWEVHARGTVQVFRTNSTNSPTILMIAGLTLLWTLFTWLLTMQLLPQIGAASGEGAAPLAQALAQANEIVDVAPDAMLVLDRGGHLVRLNAAAEQLLGATAESLLGRAITEFMRDLSPDRARAALSSGQTSLAGENRRVRLVSELTHLEHPIPVEVHMSARAPDFASFICILRDTLKERRQAEEMHLYKLAMESSANAIVISDVRLPNQPILYVNPAFERMTGYDLTETFGHQRWFLNGRDTDPVVIAKIKSAMERGTDSQATIKNYRKDGSPIWLNVTLAPVRNQSGMVTHYISVETDVTETKQIEAALSERRQQLDAIFTLSADGFAAFGLDHHVTYVNPAFLRITGLDQDEVVGASLEALDALFESVKDPSQSYVSVAEQVRMADGPERSTARAETVYLRNPAPRVLQRSLRKASGGATDFVLYLRDVTRETEVDRMKSEFLSSAAHELRTPMASVYGFAELLLRRKYPEERERDMLQTIHRQAKHLSNLVNELLDLARIEARAGKDFKMVEQSILPLVTEAVQSLLMPNDNRKVEMTLPESVPLVRADASKMRQALTNILSNAYKYSPNGGSIRLWLEERRASDRDFVGVCVADQGIGMTPEQLARACERFYRADSSGNIPGTGLGLSLVKEIMELQGGAIELASEHGAGTTVRLWLPVSSGNAQLRGVAA